MMGRDALLCQFSEIVMCAHGYVRIGPETSAIVGKCLLLLSYPPSHVSLPHHRQCIAGRIAIVQVEPWQQPGRVRRDERESGWMDGWMDGVLLACGQEEKLNSRASRGGDPWEPVWSLREQRGK